jgi:hypothetical protein
LDSHRKHKTLSFRSACGLQWKGLTQFGGQARTQSRDGDPRHGKDLRGKDQKKKRREKEILAVINSLFFFSAFTDPRGCNWRDSCADPARSPTAFQPHALLPIPRPRSCRHTHPARPRIVPLRTLWAPILTQEFTRVIPS